MEDENGNGGNGDAGQGNQDNSDQGGGDNSQQVTMSQRALDKLFQERADRAARTTEKAFFDALGIEKIEDAQKIFKEYKGWKDSQKGELEKLQDDLTAANVRIEELELDLESAQTGLVELKKKTAVVGAARDANFLKESWEDVWLLVTNDNKLSEMVVVEEDGGDVNGADKVVKEVAKVRSHWLDQKRPPGTPSGRGTGTLGGSRKPQGGQPEEQEEPLIRF